MCFLTDLDNDSMYWLKMYSHYSAGHLLNSGGIADQPAVYLQSMRLIAWLQTQE